MGWRPGPPPRPRPRYLALIGLLAGAVVLSILFSSLPALKRTQVKVSPILNWTGSDAHGEWLFGDQGTDPVYLETARYTGLNAFLSSDVTMAMGAGDIDGLRSRLWIFERRTGAGLPTESLLGEESGALVEFGFRSLDRRITFLPARQVLPANPRPGMTWEQQGRTNFGGRTSGQGQYSVKGSLADAGGGCLLVHQELTLDNESTVSDVVRCPGRGVVGDKQAGVNARPEFPAGQDPRGQVRTTPAAQGPSDSPAVQQLMVGSMETNVYVQAGVAPVDTGMVLASQLTQDLVSAYRGATDSSQVLFTRRPGGMIRSVGGFGEVMVAGTTRRELVGYDVLGRRLWITPTPDVVGQIVRLDDSRLVAVTVTGAVICVNIATGATAWTTHLPQPVSTPITVTRRGDQPMLVVPQANGVVALDQTGAELWSTDLDDPVDQLVATGSMVVLYDQNGQLIGLRLSDGKLSWAHRRPQYNYRDATALGPTRVALVGGRGVSLVDAGTGTITAAIPGDFDQVAPLPQAEGAAPAAAVVSETGWLTFSATGAVLARAELSQGMGTSPGVLRTDGHTVALANSGTLLFWGERPS